MYVADDVVIKSHFRNVVTKGLKSIVEEVNFFKSVETVDKINNFVSNATNGLIQGVLEEVSPETRLILMNVIYFKGRWKYPFFKGFTTLMDFHIDNSTQIQHSSMRLDEYLKIEYFPELESLVLDMPYENDTISMIVILPDKTTDIYQVEKKLQKFETKFLFEKLQSTHTRLTRGFFPKFEMSLDVPELTETLKSLGVNSIFDSNADLSNISEEELFVSNINHKAVVEVSTSSNSFLRVTV